MKYISIFLRSIFITLLLSSITVRASSSEKPDPEEKILRTIQEFMDRAPTLWPDEWRQEYIETIRKAILTHQNTPQYNLKLEILGKGFESYWGSFKKTKERSLFEVHSTRIRWYTEHLMGTEFPTEQEKKKLRDQYTDIWDHASSSLLAQFPFLNPNTVQNAKADDLSECYRKIEAPLMPVYLRPFSDEQMTQIKQRWDKLRYIRVDLLRRLDGGLKTLSENDKSNKYERDYELTKESLSQLLGLVWKVVPQRPDYYLEAIKNRIEALKLRIQSNRQARSYQQRLEKERSRQLLQTEHIGFLLVALLETPECLDGATSIRTQEQIPLKRQEKRSKGGDAFEVDNVSPEE